MLWKYAFIFRLYILLLVFYHSFVIVVAFVAVVFFSLCSFRHSFRFFSRLLRYLAHILSRRIRLMLLLVVFVFFCAVAISLCCYCRCRCRFMLICFMLLVLSHFIFLGHTLSFTPHIFVCCFILFLVFFSSYFYTFVVVAFPIWLVLLFAIFLLSHAFRPTHAKC